MKLYLTGQKTFSYFIQDERDETTREAEIPEALANEWRKVCDDYFRIQRDMGAAFETPSSTLKTCGEMPEPARIENVVEPRSLTQ